MKPLPILNKNSIFFQAKIFEFIISYGKISPLIVLAFQLPKILLILLKNKINHFPKFLSSQNGLTNSFYLKEFFLGLQTPVTDPPAKLFLVT